MLKGIDPLLSADLLWLLAAMGHGDDLAVVDLNHPAETIVRSTISGCLVRLPGVAVDRAVGAILTVLPLDTFTSDPVRGMQVVGDADAAPEAFRDISRTIAASGYAGPIVRLERFAFYAAAKAAFGVVQCGDPRFYGNILLRKGAIEGARPA
jgi:L-fucose mutarotase